MLCGFREVSRFVKTTRIHLKWATYLHCTVEIGHFALYPVRLKSISDPFKDIRNETIYQCENIVLRNFLDEKVFFLHETIDLTCFQSEKSQNKLDLIHDFVLKCSPNLVKINFKREQSIKSHASVIFNTYFAWIFAKALSYILSRLSASKLLRKALKLPRKHAMMNKLSVQI